MAYFLYIDLGLCVQIPSKHTCYHTFGGAMGYHATAVPIVIDHKYSLVDFGHDDLFVFAWGAGKSASHKFEPSKNAAVDSAGVPVPVSNRKKYEDKDTRKSLSVKIVSNTDMNQKMPGV